MNKTFFVLQIFLPFDATRSLHQSIWNLLKNEPQESQLRERYQFWYAMAVTLIRHSSLFAYGNWDYIEDPGEAESEFDSWCSGTVDDIADAENAGYLADAYRGQPQFMFVTMMVKLVAGSTTDQFVNGSCRMDDSMRFNRQTFANLCNVFAQLNFAHVAEERVFLRPGTGTLAVTQQELSDPRYQYLHAIR